MTGWVKQPVDGGVVRRVADRFGLDLLVSSIAVRRGMAEPGAMRFLLESDVRYLHNPFQLSGVGAAVARINAAIGSGEKIAVFGDRDVDGVTSTVLVTETLDRLGGAVEWRVPEGEDGYGLTSELVQELAEAGVGLLITVDTGVAAVAEVAVAKAHDLDVVVVDHHEPQATMPDAIVVDPKREDCPYPFAGLCACGVAAKLMWALLFSQGELYNTPVCLIDARPLNDSVAIEAVRVTNLVPEATFYDTVVSAAGGETSARVAGRLEEFASGCALLAYDATVVERFLARALGGVQVELEDLAEPFGQLVPRLGGKSLLQLREQSRAARYSSGEFGEMDVLREVFTVLALNRLTESPLSTWSLELPAVATVADQMPLVDENRIIVAEGLRQLSHTERPGLRELLAREGLFGRDLAPKDISFKIGPVINAAGRMGKAGIAVRLLMAETAEQAAEIADELGGLNDARREASDGAWQRCLPRARRSLDENAGRLAFASDGNMPRGVTGMIANRLLDTLGVPSVVVAVKEENATGSMRTRGAISAVEFLASCGDLLTKHGGHAAAAGFSLSADRLEALEGRMAMLAGELPEPTPLEDRAREVDAEIPAEFLAPELWSAAQLFAPYGVGNPQLVFISRRLPVANVELVGKAEPGHVKLVLDTGRFRWPALYWNAADKIDGIEAGGEVDVVFRLSKSTFQDQDQLQLTVLDLAPAGEN